jgi:hypothetical protein
MKSSQTSTLSTVLSAVLCGACLWPQAAFCQGSLTPPGTPAPTMKSLDQIEPRTPITNATAVIISASGSYYLTTNITVSTNSAITITANGVTLDLNGFTISSTAAGATGTGILLAGGNADITILNGHIKGGVTNNGSGVYGGGGFANGITYSVPTPSNVRVAGVSVSGCLSGGILLANSVSIVVESCTVQTIGGYGIVAASVSHSVAYQCGTIAISARTASDCSGWASPGEGLVAASADNCSGISDNGIGLQANTANNCSGFSITGNYGLFADSANNCYGSAGISGTGLAGLSATIANNCYGLNSSGTGLDSTTANNCQGQSNSGTGLNAHNIAIGCYGSSSSGTGLSAFIANSCDGTSFNVTHKYNMP